MPTSDKNHKPPRYSKWLGIGFKSLVSLCILVYILSLVDIENVWQIIKGSKVIYFILGIVLIFASVVSEGAKYYLVFSRLEPGICFRRTMFIQMASCFYGTIIPAGGISQEIARGAGYKKQGYSYSDVLGVLFALKGIGLYLLGGLGMLGLLELGYGLHQTGRMVLVFGFIAVTVMMVLFGYNHRAFECIENIFQKKIRISAFNISENLVYLFGTAKTLVLRHKRILWEILFTNIVSILLYVVGLVSFARALDLDISFFNMAWAGGLCGIAQVFPIGSQFIGAKDITLWYILKDLGYGANQTGSFLIFMNSGILLVNLMGYPLMLFERHLFDSMRKGNK